MKWIIYISFLMLAWLFCSADGCNEEARMSELREERQVLASRDSIKNTFEFDIPDDRLLRSYEATAKQKLLDFADYLKIASDSTLDLTFRHQAAGMAEKLFINPAADITGWSRTFPFNYLKTIDDLPEKILSHGITHWIHPVQVAVRKPLTMKNDTVYTGNLSFHPELISYDKQNYSEKTADILVADIYMVRKTKSFGKDFLSIWEIYLGNIGFAVNK